MLGLILAATLAQVHADDFYMMQATENFVIDSLPKPVRYSQYIPKEVCDQVDIWAEDCWRCRKLANERVIAMGPSVIRWLFWPIRSKNLRISMHSEAVINGLIKCRYCDGGKCPGYVEDQNKSGLCDICDVGKYWHSWDSYKCIHCGGAGIFILP